MRWAQRQFAARTDPIVDRHRIGGKDGSQQPLALQATDRDNQRPGQQPAQAIATSQQATKDLGHLFGPLREWRKERKSRHLLAMTQRGCERHRAAQRMPNQQHPRERERFDQRTDHLRLRIERGLDGRAPSGIARARPIDRDHAVGPGQFVHQLVAEVAQLSGQPVNQQQHRLPGVCAGPPLEHMQAGLRQFDNETLGRQHGFDAPDDAQRDPEREQHQHRNGDDDQHRPG